MTYNELKNEENKYVMNTYGRFPIALDHGKGATLWDVEGKKYIDLASGIGVNCMGYDNQILIDAITRQAHKIMHASNLFTTEPMVQVAKKLVEKTHLNGKVFFANSGAESNEGAIKLARKYFRVIGIEIYPLNVDEYAYLHECGVDYVTVFQETYDDQKYKTLHLGGHKRIFPYRLNAQERAIMGGMRGVGFAALLGLSDFRKDAFATGMHAYLLQRKYPHAEIAFSCPRLRPIINDATVNPHDVHETQLLQVLLAYRLFMPCAGITISTRERAGFRDHIIGMAATKISAGVKVGVGGHEEEAKGDEQFEISDGRSVDEVYNAICEHGLQPVMADYVYV